MEKSINNTFDIRLFVLDWYFTSLQTGMIIYSFFASGDLSRIIQLDLYQDQ